MREFDTGATRDSDDTKLDFEGFLSPLVMERYAQYLHEHRLQADGEMRDSDNWQKGIPLPVYMKSAWRHFFLWWKLHRVMVRGESLTTACAKEFEDTICAVLFNGQGYLHEWLSIDQEQPAETEPQDIVWRDYTGQAKPPLCPDDVQIEIETRDGTTHSDRAGSFIWTIDGDDSDIIKWRYLDD